MKKIFFFLPVILFLSFTAFGQNPDFDISGNKPLIPEFNDFSLTTAAWTPLPVSPHAYSRSCCCAIYKGDTLFIYQFGGGTVNTQQILVARYNAMTNAWTPSYATMPFNISSGSAVRIPGDSLIYVIGGTNSPAVYGKTLKYNVYTNTFTTMADMTPNPCTDQFTVVYKDSLIYAIGGGDGLFNTAIQYNSVRVYNINTNTWSSATNLPTNLSMMGGGIWGDTIIVACGVTGSGAYTANVYKGIINPTNHLQITWTTLPVLYPAGSMTRMGSFVVRHGNSCGVVFTGGAISGATVSSQTNFYNLCTQAFQTLPANSLARSNFKGTGFGDSIMWVVGGYTTVGVGTFEKITFSQIDGGCLLTSIGNETEIPLEYKLSQNYPNPFNPLTKISFSIPKSDFVKLAVYDILGKEVSVLVNERRNSGSYIIDFDASSLTSGVYFYKLTSGDFTDMKKMILLK
ncbi:MAG: T9SS type A sorting domain-containing protein [Ignavibacteria bacterium]|nr:T9SS type A sorting domain-containing protein [Ignavibacteria bacterium]